jgi:hypothetical protein
LCSTLKITVNVAISLFPADATADTDHITF